MCTGSLHQYTSRHSHMACSRTRLRLQRNIIFVNVGNLLYMKNQIASIKLKIYVFLVCPIFLFASA